MTRRQRLLIASANVLKARLENKENPETDIMLILSTISTKDKRAVTRAMISHFNEEGRK